MKIKICGIKTTEEIEIMNQVKPDYIGFVFAKSRVQVSYKKASELKKLLNPEIRAVGVFLDHEESLISDLLENKVIDIVQLHGQESDDYLKKMKTKFPEVPIIKAVRNGEEYIRPVDHILFDNEKGENGKKLDWGNIPKTEVPFFLAGGINLDNIKEAVKISPYAIDLSSGAETNGYKDIDKCRQIVEIIRNS